MKGAPNLSSYLPEKNVVTQQQKNYNSGVWASLAAHQTIVWAANNGLSCCHYTSFTTKTEGKENYKLCQDDL